MQVNKQSLLILGLLFSASSFAQKVAKPEAYAKTITAADLKKHLYIVASAEMEGRETATEGQRKAAAYIETQFRNLGLLPGNNGSYQQFYPVTQDSLTEASMEVNGQKFLLDKDFNVSINNMPAVQAFSELVYIGPNVSADSLRNANLQGKLLLVAQEATTQQGQGGRGAMSPRMQILNTKGAAAILTISANYPRTQPASRKGAQSTQFFKRSIPPQSFTISEGVAQAIGGKNYESLKTEAAAKTVMADVLLNVQKATKMMQSSNVLALLPGTDLKDEYLFITAHYDHLGKRGDSVIYYGADDDGSGTVSVIEMAEAFVKAKAAGHGPRRSIVFMTVSGEEKGLWGSDYYGSHPVYPLEKTTADLNIDMIGRIDSDRKVGDSTNYVYVVGDDKLSSELRTISEMVNKKSGKMELDYKFNDPNDTQRIYFRSDHYNFAKHGVPIIFYYDGMLKGDYHRPTDTPDKINYTLMAKRAQLVFYTAWEMANRNEMLKRDISLPIPSRSF
ncbi:MAG: M28 family peptidase [Chitinophagaceae bacterium]